MAFNYLENSSLFLICYFFKNFRSGFENRYNLCRRFIYIWKCPWFRKHHLYKHQTMNINILTVTFFPYNNIQFCIGIFAVLNIDKTKCPTRALWCVKRYFVTFTCDIPWKKCSMLTGNSESIDFILSFFTLTSGRAI